MSDIPIVDRVPGALQASSDPEALRLAYLSLLKMGLTDLLGVRTQTIHWNENGNLFLRHLKDEEMRFRVNGIDWPAHGMTMVGLERLDDLQGCVEEVVRNGVEGDLIEAGTWRGGASILMRATLNSLGVTDRTVWLADSFSGFPMPDREAYPEDSGIDFSDRDFIAVPIEEVKGNLDKYGCGEGVEFVPGFFEDTMAGMAAGTWAIVRLDGDSYESTMLTLSKLYPGLSRGGYLIVDDYGALPECRRAVTEYREAHDITAPMETIDWTGVKWRKETDSEPEKGQAPVPSRREKTDRRVVRQGGHRIPTMRERLLQDEIDQLKTKLEQAEANAK
ncbi:MAG: macrocin O-methyltransferase [Thermoleophilia bacterium]|nr:macrocin O-methyltransferase [Thermoleophilia bacterium]